MSEERYFDGRDFPPGYTVNGVDQSELVQCQVRRCGVIMREEMFQRHMELTHGYVEQVEDEVDDTRIAFY